MAYLQIACIMLVVDCCWLMFPQRAAVWAHAQADGDAHVGTEARVPTESKRMRVAME